MRRLEKKLKKAGWKSNNYIDSIEFIKDSFSIFVKETAEFDYFVNDGGFIYDNSYGELNKDIVDFISDAYEVSKICDNFGICYYYLKVNNYSDLEKSIFYFLDFLKDAYESAKEK